MKKLLLLLLILGSVLTLLICWAEGRLYSLLPGSRLEYFDTRIASVDTELMRRIPELPENFSDFDQCIRRRGCDVAPILAKRNTLVQKNWPEVLPRLMVDNDWGTKNFSITPHQEFLKDVRQVGGQKKAKRCRPLLRYYLLESSVSIYTYKGLRCS